MLSDDIVFSFAEDRTRATLHLGAGFSVRLPRASLVAEVNDFSNKVEFYFEEESRGRVHDTVASLGLSIPVR